MAAYNIPLAVEPPKVENPLDAYTKAANLGHIQQERQLRQQQIQENALKLQDMSEQHADQEKLAQLYTQHNGDLPKVIESAPALGVRPKTVEALRLQHQQNLERAAQTDEATLKNQQTHADRMLGRIDAVKAVKDPVAQAAAWAQQVQDALRSGDIDQQHAQALQTYPGPDKLDGIYAELMGHKGYADAGLKAQQEARAAAKAKEEADKAALEAAESPLKLEEAQNKAVTSGLDVAARTVDQIPATGPVAVKPLFMAPGPTKGLVRPGNINLRDLPVIDNGDGTKSTVYGTSFQDEDPKSPTFGKEILVRGIIDGKKTDDVNALRAQYAKDHKTLGIFNTPEAADAYAERIHNDWEKIPGVNRLDDKVREPYPSEAEYFKKNPSVSGMATEDGKVILNPFSTLNAQEKAAVVQNETARLFMRENGMKPAFEVTEEQKDKLRGSDYVKPGNEAALKETIAARILSGDPSAGTITPQQKSFVEKLRKQMEAKSAPDARQTAWADWRNSLSESVRDRIPEEWSPEAVARVKKMGLSGYQQTEAGNAAARDKRAEEREDRLSQPKTIPEMALEAADPTISPERKKQLETAIATAAKHQSGATPKPDAVQNRFDIKEFDKYSKMHQDLQAKEHTQWNLVGELGDLSHIQDDEKYFDPITKKTVTMSPSQRVTLQHQYQDARDKATKLKKDAEDIRKRFGWGDFEGKAETPGAGDQKAAPVEGDNKRVIITLPNGRTKIFPNQKAADDFSKAAGLSYQK